jgi:HD-like signal output (HDOD) protein
LAGAELCHAEQDAFGQTHAQAGAQLAEAWALPPAIVEAIESHHVPGPEAPQGPVAQAVWLASLVGDGELGRSAMPALTHIQADIAQAQAASQREVAALFSVVGV